VLMYNVSCMRMQPLTPEPQGAGLGAPPFLGMFLLLSGYVTHITGTADSLLSSVKYCSLHADTVDMIISDEQARLAAQYMRSGPHRTATPAVEVPSELMDRVREILAACPECRDERVEEARDRMAHGHPDAGEVASKMLSRIVSDSLR